MKDSGHVFFAIALAAVASSACAMTAPETAAPRCQVLKGEELLRASGGTAALCRAIDRAVAARGLDMNFTVQVRVDRRSIFSADVTLAGGRKLPTVHMAEMDRAVTKDTLDRFGLAVVNHIVSAP